MPVTTEMAAKNLIGETVFVLTISHRHGDNITVHATEAGARAALADYCREWWTTETRGRDAGAQMPEDDDVLIEAYFEFAEDETANYEPQKIAA